MNYNIQEKALEDKKDKIRQKLPHLSQIEAESFFEDDFDMFKKGSHSFRYINKKTNKEEEITYEVTEDIDDSPETMKIIRKRNPKNTGGLVSFTISHTIKEVV